MNPSTASHRLVKDILFSLVRDTPCYHCSQPLTRDTFSIEHKQAWLDSHDPKALFFNLDNISFSHLACNVKAARRHTVDAESQRDRSRAYDKRYKLSMTKDERQRRRREQYIRTGK